MILLNMINNWMTHYLGLDHIDLELEASDLS